MPRRSAVDPLCVGAHRWTSDTDEEPKLGDPCDCGLKKWGVPLRTVREHEWEFYANGSFCRRCGAAIGSGAVCR